MDEAVDRQRRLSAVPSTLTARVGTVSGEGEEGRQMVGGAGVAMVNRRCGGTWTTEDGRFCGNEWGKWIWSPGYSLQCLYAEQIEYWYAVVHVVVHVVGKVQRSSIDARKRKRRLLANASDETRKGSLCSVPRRIGGERA